MTSQFLSDLVTQHLTLAYVLIFLVSLGEALFVIGLVMPSTVVLVGAGALAGAGRLDLWLVLALGTLGAAVGDALSYWIGKRYGDRIRVVWPFRNYRHLLDTGEAFFERHGGKSIFIGRFIPGVKSVIPGIAGMAKMGFGRFTVVNVASALPWAALHVLPAAGIGLALGRVNRFDPRLAILGGALVALVVVTWYLLKIVLVALLPVLAAWRERRLAGTADCGTRMARVEAAVLGVSGEMAGGALVLGIAVLGLAGFATLAANVLFEPELAAADAALYNLIQSWRTPFGTSVMTAVTMSADVIVLGVTSSVLVVWLMLRRHWRVAVAATVAIAGATLLVPLVKAAIGRARPNTLYAGADAFSFPSGHATLSMAVFGVVAAIFAARMRPSRRPFAFALAVLGAGVVALSRLYLGAHWMSDVAAGLSLGLMVSLALMFVLQRWHAARVDRVDLRALALVLLVAYGGTYAFHLQRDHARWVAEYAVDDAVRTLGRADWIGGGYRTLPAARRGLDGDAGAPLAFQTDLTPDELTARMASVGWEPLATGSPLDALFPSRAPFAERPALPLLENGRSASLAFTPGPIGGETLPALPSDGRYVLRFWPTDARVDVSAGDDRPILVGALAAEEAELFAAGYGTVEAVEDLPALAKALDTLRVALGGSSATDTPLLVTAAVDISDRGSPGRRPEQREAE